MKAFFSRNKIITALLTALGVWLLMFALTGFRLIYATNDDYNMSLLFSNGEKDSLYLGYFFSHAMGTLQTSLPVVNWFVLFQLTGSFAAIVVINYVFFCRFTIKQSLTLAIGFNLTVIWSSTVLIQWTHTSALLATAGWTAVINALFWEKRKRYKVLQLVYGVLSMLLCKELRDVSFELASAFAALFMFCCWLRTYIDLKKKSKEIVKTALRAFSEYVVPVVVCVAVAVGVLGFNMVSVRLRADTDYYKNHKGHNIAHSRYSDYEVAPYEGNEEFYNSLGIKSQTVIDFSRRWNLDKDFFTEEKLNTIREYAREKGYGQTKLQNIVKNHLAVFAVTGLLTLAAVAAVTVLLYKYRRKMRRVLPFMIVLIWAVFFKLNGLNDASVAMIPIAAFLVYMSFRDTKRHFFNVLLFSFAVVFLYLYLTFSRISFRAVYTFVVPATVFLILVFAKLGINEREKQHTGLKILNVVLGLLVVCLANNHFYHYHIKCRPVYFDTQLYNYVKSTPDVTYMYNYQPYEYLDPAYWQPLLVPSHPDNTVMYGDWYMMTDYYEKELRSKKIDRLFEDMIDSDDKRFILVRNYHEDVLPRTIDYYNSCYADDDTKIDLVKETELEFASIYKVVSIKK